MYIKDSDSVCPVSTMSTYDCPIALQDANSVLQKRYDDVVSLINRIEQLEYAASTSNRPFEEIPDGGFVIDETIWTDIRADWQCRITHPLGETLADAALFKEQADEFLAIIDKNHHAPALKAHDESRAHFIRVTKAWD